MTAVHCGSDYCVRYRAADDRACGCGCAACAALSAHVRAPEPPRPALVLVPLPCKHCNGRGWLRRKGHDWATPCAACDGAGHRAFTRRALAKLCGLGDGRTLDRVHELRARPATYVRVLTGLHRAGLVEVSP